MTAKRIVGTTHVTTGVFTPAPTHCVECGQPITVVRHLVATMYECSCAACEVTFVVSMRDRQAF